MLKKLLSVLLAAIMLSTLAACADKKTNGNDADDTADAAVSTTVPEQKKWEIPEDIELTDSQREAAESAEKHLNATGVSRATLVNTLIDEGHSEEDAEFVVDIFGIDWKEMARGTAEFYTYYMPFSYKGIIDHLVYMGFTEEQALYGADQLELDWDLMATKYIEKYYLYGSFDNGEIIATLEEAGFTNEQAVKGLEEYEADLAEQSSLRESLGLD